MRHFWPWPCPLSIPRYFMTSSSSRARAPRRSRITLLAALLLALGLVLGLAACGNSSQADSPLAVAMVNGHPISLSDFQQVVALYKAGNNQAGSADWQS